MPRRTARRGRRVAAVTTASLLLAAGAVIGGGTALAAERATTCRAVSVPFTVGDQSGPIAGTLCVPPGASTVQLLVHGWTYEQHYFDWPDQPETYSYARAANAAGYATLAIDRLGSGASMRPISLFHTFQAGVNAMHTVVQALRDGSLGSPFHKVIAVGHSLGSMTVSHEAGQYKDVDALITTGFSHSINYLSTFPRVVGRDYPARSDPKFAGTISDPAYLTSMPGTRKYFYHEPNVDPAVVERDEELKSTGSLVELATLGTYNLLNVDRTLEIPVLALNGQKEPFFCGLQAADCTSDESLAAHERPWYGPGAVVEAATIPDTGHNTAIEKTAPFSARRMLEFCDKYVGRGSGAVGTAPGKRPPVPAPSTAPVSPLDQAVGTAFTTAVLPAVGAYSDAISGVPGLGDSTNPIPGTSEALSTIGNLNDQLLGTLPQEALANL